MKRRNVKNLAKTIVKNHIIFRKKIFFDVDFSDKLKLLMNKYHDAEKVKRIIYSIVSGREYVANNFQSTLESASAKFIKKGLATFERLSEDVRLDLSKSVSHFIAEFDLGKEWRDTLLILVTTGKFYPPHRNFHIGGSSAVDKKRVVITLNPDTSLEDLAADWDIIKRLQKFLWPNFKKTNITRQSIKNFDVSFKTEIMRIEEANKENRAKISSYDEKFYDPIDLKKSEKIINEYRAKRRASGEDRKAKPVKFKRQISYKKLNKINKGNRGSYNNLNQQRKRAKI
jgi:hypothetical protein